MKRGSVNPLLTSSTFVLTASIWQPWKLHETFMSRSRTQAPSGDALTQQSCGSELSQVHHWNFSQDPNVVPKVTQLVLVSFFC